MGLEDDETEIVRQARELGRRGGIIGEDKLLVIQLLQSELLFSLCEGGALDGMALQGGAALLRAYGGARLSSDLDFAAVARPDIDALERACSIAESRIREEFDTKARVRVKAGGHGGSSIVRMRAKVPMSHRVDVPHVFAEAEFAVVPAYTAAPRDVNGPLDVTRGPWLPLVPTEGPSELMADKLVSAALAARRVAETGRGPLRARDAVDVCWLRDVAGPDGREVGELVARKERDYGVEPGTVAEWVCPYIEMLSGRGWKALAEAPSDVWDPGAMVRDGRDVVTGFAAACEDAGIGDDMSRWIANDVTSR